MMDTRLPPDQSLGFQVRRCHRAFDRVLNARLSREGFSSGFWYFLRALWMEDGATQKRLAQLTNVTESTAVTVLSGMDKLGLIDRVRNPDDRRKVNVFLTPRAEGLEDELIPIAMDINAIARAGVLDQDLSTCLAVLKKVTDNLAAEARRLSAEPSE